MSVLQSPYLSQGNNSLKWIIKVSWKKRKRVWCIFFQYRKAGVTGNQGEFGQERRCISWLNFKKEISVHAISGSSIIFKNSLKWAHQESGLLYYPKYSAIPMNNMYYSREKRRLRGSLTELCGGAGLQFKSTTGYLTGTQLGRRISEKASLVDWCNSCVHNKPREVSS